MARLDLSPGKEFLDAVCAASERHLRRKDGEVGFVFHFSALLTPAALKIKGGLISSG